MSEEGADIDLLHSLGIGQYLHSVYAGVGRSLADAGQRFKDNEGTSILTSSWSAVHIVYDFNSDSKLHHCWLGGGTVNSLCPFS